MTEATLGSLAETDEGAFIGAFIGFYRDIALGIGGERIQEKARGG